MGHIERQFRSFHFFSRSHIQLGYLNFRKVILQEEYLRFCCLIYHQSHRHGLNISLGGRYYRFLQYVSSHRHPGNLMGLFI